MKLKCVECKVYSKKGLIDHSSSCSAKVLRQEISIDYFRPPAIEIEFENKAEQQKFYTNMQGGAIIND